jgi:hypothetical protein
VRLVDKCHAVGIDLLGAAQVVDDGQRYFHDSSPVEDGGWFGCAVYAMDPESLLTGRPG